MDDCIFCKIIREEVPREVLQENGDAVIIPDIRPSAPFHYLVIPKQHIVSIQEVAESDAEMLGRLVLFARSAAHKLGLTGYKLLFNVGRDGGQIVDHLHLHLLGGWKADEPKKINA